MENPQTNKKTPLPFWLPFALILGGGLVFAIWIEFGPTLSSRSPKPKPAADESVSSKPKTPPFDRAALHSMILLGRRNLLSRQEPSGRFIYEYDFIRQQTPKGDNAVRQAGTLWGLTLSHQYAPSRISASAIERGFDYFTLFTRPAARGGRFIVYPGEKVGTAGSIALLCLAYVDYIRTLPKGALRTRYEEQLLGYFEFLMTLRQQNGLFAKNYRLNDGLAILRPGEANNSPYYDGEGMLAMAKAARHLEGYEHFLDKARWSAEVAYTRYVTAARARDPDSNNTKGFFQWGILTFLEIHDPQQEETRKYAEWGVELGHWMIDTHKVLERKRNTAYAFEGICAARELARQIGDVESVSQFDDATRKGLRRLVTWQVAGPYASENPFLTHHPTQDPKAIGAVMNGARDPVLRIDVTQHQIHAMILALRYVWREKE